MLRTTTRATAALGVGVLLLSACGEDTDDGTDGTASAEDPPDDEASEADDAEEANEGGDDAGDGPAGTVTLNGESVELDRAHWCADYEGPGPGATEMWTTGQIITEAGHYGNKVHAGTFEADDGTLIDHVAIYQWDTFDDAPRTGTWSVDEGEDGYPWIEVDGQEVTIDGTFVDEDGAEFEFTADLVAQEETGSAVLCPAW